MKTSAMSISLPSKSTNVRLFRGFDLRRAAFHILSLCAPGAAARSAARLFLTPPAPRPLSPRAVALFDRADDRFAVKLETDFGGRAESSAVNVALWGRGPAVYMLHGWGGRGAQWTSFVDPLVRAGFTAVVLDAPGHGDSPAPRTSILHFAAALTAVVDSVGPARAVLGHSLGGAAAVLAMRRGLVAERAVLIGTPADPAEFFDVFLGRLGIPARLAAPIRRDVERSYGFSWSELAVAAPASVIDGPAAPALVVHDAGDRDVDHADAARIAKAWPNADVVTTHGLGHQRILRDAAVVADIVFWLSGGQASARGDV
jgi:pimeloyl-ACP methyl ester carboxylesterase